MTENSPLVIGLAGFGTVGSGLAEILRLNADLIRARIGRDIRIKTVLVRDTTKARTYALPEGAKVTTNPSDLVNDPEIILADEPTGALDSHSTDELLKLFKQINEEGQTILMVTHSIKAASHAKRVLFIKDGEVFHQLYKGSMSDEELYQKISDTLSLIATGGERYA